MIYWIFIFFTFTACAMENNQNNRGFNARSEEIITFKFEMRRLVKLEVAVQLAREQNPQNRRENDQPAEEPDIMMPGLPPVSCTVI